MKVELIRHTPNPEELCGEAAAICTAQTDYGKALRGALASGHESVIEHAVFTFRVEGVSRALLAQITRHRLASFSVESQRYVMGSGRSAVVPPGIEADIELSGLYDYLQSETARFYAICIRKGIPAEDARYGFLQGGGTKFIVTMNARELRHFFSLRCCNRAQWEIRALADEMLRLCKAAAPGLFKDAGPGCVRGSCPEGNRTCGQPRKQMIEKMEEGATDGE